MYSYAFHTKKYFLFSGFVLNFNDWLLSIPLTAVLSVSDKWIDAELILFFTLNSIDWSKLRFHSKKLQTKLQKVNIKQILVWKKIAVWHTWFSGGRSWHRKRDTLFQMLASINWPTTVMMASKKGNRLDKTHKLVVQSSNTQMKIECEITDTDNRLFMI